MNEIVLSATTGLSVTAQLYLGAAPIGTPIAMTEVATTGEYICSMPAVAAGYYLVVFTAATEKIGSGYINWDGSAEVNEVQYGLTIQGYTSARAAKLDNLNATISGVAATVRTELATELAEIRWQGKVVKNKRMLKKIADVWFLIVYDDNGETPILTKELRDPSLKQIADIADGVLSMELANSV